MSKTVDRPRPGPYAVCEFRRAFRRSIFMEASPGSKYIGQAHIPTWASHMIWEAHITLFFFFYFISPILWTRCFRSLSYLRRWTDGAYRERTLLCLEPTSLQKFYGVLYQPERGKSTVGEGPHARAFASRRPRWTAVNRGRIRICREFNTHPSVSKRIS